MKKKLTEITYESADDAAISVAPELYYITMNTNKECMVGIYSIKTLTGEIYFSGPILLGMHNNVVVSTFITVSINLGAGRLTNNCVSLVGMVHSHPYCNGHISEKYSGYIGDEGAILLTGSCYLITPQSRELYKISRADVVSAFLHRKAIADNMLEYQCHSYPDLSPYSEPYLCK